MDIHKICLAYEQGKLAKKNGIISNFYDKRSCEFLSWHIGYTYGEKLQYSDNQEIPETD